MKTTLEDINLRIPGPVALPDEVRAAVATPVINHRGGAFAELFERLTVNLKKCLKTNSDVYFVTSSGTGVMEMAAVNALSPGDNALCVSIGWFGDRFGDIAEAYGVNVERLRYAPGQAARPQDVAAKLKTLKDVKAVLLTHNESSTGVCNPLKDLCATIKSESDALILVDAVSSAGGIELETDAWGVDAAATAAQKSWVAPAGISMLSFSDKAWRAYERSTMPKYYLDIGMYRQYAAKKQPPFTPCVTSLFALDLALSKHSDDIDAFIRAHSEMADHVRERVSEMGLSILPEDANRASNTVTAVKIPASIDGDEFLRRALDEHKVEFGDGPGELKGKVFRIGHMGWLDYEQIDAALDVAAELIDEMRG